eukprot:TRINITY_DN6337_c0_g3_i1.p1 TRINITY_DN6337_c0_g3~~TRINITY_DN6337_c0_g3_i1.p1  ORF type:complete len:335 (+),score=61.10 TRINITY_DN6337_c0_g3_i1:60-1064(+)
MGGSASSITFQADEVSPSDSSVKSVVSCPLDEVKFEDEAFWKAWGEYKREPVALPTGAGLLGISVKSHEVTEQADGSFKVQDVLAYFGKDVDINFEHSYDPSTNTWTQTSNRDEMLNEVVINLHIRLHSSPRVLEIWATTKEGRTAADAIAMGAAYFLGEILKDMGVTFEGKSDEEAKEFVFNKFKANQDALDGSGEKSCVSEPLEEYLNAEQLLECLEQVWRSGKGGDDQTSFEILEDYGPGKGYKAKVGIVSQGMDMFVLVKFDQAELTTLSTFFATEDCKVPLFEFVHKVHKEGCRWEAYLQNYPNRYSGPSVKATCEKQIPEILGKVIQS